VDGFCKKTKELERLEKRIDQKIKEQKDSEAWKHNLRRIERIKAVAHYHVFDETIELKEKHFDWLVSEIKRLGGIIYTKEDE